MKNGGFLVHYKLVSLEGILPVPACWDLIKGDEMKIRVCIPLVVLFFCFGSAFGEWVGFNDCARPDNLSDSTAANVTSWTIYGSSDPSLSSGLLKDFSTGVDTNCLVNFTMNGSLRTSPNSGGVVYAGTDVDDIFGGVVDFGGWIVYYDNSTGWYVDIEFSGLDPDKKYSFVGTAIRDSDYPDRQSEFTLSGHISAVNVSSAGVVFKGDDTTILFAGDNGPTGYVVRWDDIKVSDDGSGTGSFVIRAQSSEYTNALDTSDQGKAYPFGGFMLEELADDTIECPAGDLNGDCIVDEDDLAIFAGSWLDSGMIAANLDGVGDVDGYDFAILAGNWAKNAQAGSLQVTIDAPVPADAQWRVDDGEWQDSDDIVKGLAAGEHTVSFSDVSGYDKPNDRTVVVVFNDTTVINDSYTPKPGSVTVTITDPVPGGAGWRVDDGSWQGSGDVVGGLVVGDHTIEFADVAGYDKPDDVIVTILPGSSETVVAGYSALPGSLTVTLDPAGAQWRVDEGAWQSGGDTVNGLSMGDHLIEYGDVGGYDTPASETITLGAGEDKTISRSYTALPGSLTVTLDPANGQWRIDGGAWQVSGATVSGLSVGGHFVEYNDVEGYGKPANETVTIAPGESKAIARIYTPDPGSLTVTLDVAGGQWRIDNGAWQTSGDKVSGLSAGDHLVDYGDVSGYDKPAEETITLSAGEDKTIGRSYTALPGSITVTLDPAGGQWRVDNGGWQVSGAKVSGLTAGDHLVEYNDLTGYDKPVSETITLAPGEDKTIAGSYTALPGSITVTLDPAGGQWRVDNGAWQDSGATVSDLVAGDHLVEYNDVTGYDKPLSETITLAPGEDKTIGRSYTALPGSITVTLDPAGGQWRVDNGAWQGSGAKVSGLTVGGHVVEYNDLAGYDKPVDETVTLAPGEDKTISRSYTAQLASLSITFSDPIPAGAQWRVGGGVWQPSEAVVTGLSAGDHPVEYDVVTGYDEPVDEAVTLAPGEVRTVLFPSPAPKMAVLLKYPVISAEPSESADML